MNKVYLNKHIIEQQGYHFKVQVTQNRLDIPDHLGEGSIDRFSFGEGLDLHHFKYILNKLHPQQSINPDDSGIYVLMVNLSHKALQKVVNGNEISIHKYQTVGLIAFPPGSSVTSVSEPGENHEMIVIRLHHNMLAEYFGADNSLFQTLKSMVYEDLNYNDEELVIDILNNRSNKLKTHGLILEFVGSFMDKLLLRQKHEKTDQIHPDDLKGLFTTAGLLRDPMMKEVPTIHDLAKLANMGTTKYKALFKQVFGIPVKQYHTMIKFDYAQKQLILNHQSITELSHALGYSHPSKFTEAYKKRFGQLPSVQKAKTTKRDS